MTVLAHAPLLEQHSRRVFTAKKGSDSLFKRSAEEHGGARFFFLPSVKVAVPVPARTAEVLADLGVGVGHRVASSVLEGEALDIACTTCPFIGLCLDKPALVEAALVRKPGVDFGLFDELAY